MSISKQIVSEERLSMSRAKPRSLAASASYRARWLFSAILGKETMLKMLLNGSRLMWRHAFELTGELYDSDFHASAKATNEEFIKKWIGKDERVVDIGCGVGRWSRIAANYAKEVVGVDFDSELIEIANRTNKAENIEFFVGDVTKHFAEKSFDTAIVSHVIEHIDDTETFLQDLHKVAKRLIVEVPDFEADSLNLVRLSLNLPFFSDADHVQEYTLPILTEQLLRNGWTTIESVKRNGAIVVVAEES